MNRLLSRRARLAGSWHVLMSVAVVLAASATAEAGVTLGSSAATIKYMLDSTSGAGTIPVFDTNPLSTTASLLLTPGGGFPILGGPVPGTPTQTTFGDLSSTLMVPSSTVPAAFGTANTVLFAQGAGQQGAVTTQGGIFWDTRTSLQDGLQPTDTGMASVSYSSANSMFTNNTGAPLTINPGALLSVQGTVGGTAGSYVAAALTSSYILSGTTNVVNNFGITIAANSRGQSVNQTGNLLINATSISFFRNQLTASASSYFGPQPITLADGQSITIAATLTLVADPMSTISIVSSLAPGFPGDATLPDFGAFAGGSPFTPGAAPEPSTFAMLGLGLATAAAWRSRARRPGRA